MNLALWIVTGVLAAVFLISSAKVFVPYEKLAVTNGAGWVNDFSPGFVKTLGGIEFLGAVGLILPGATGIAPFLVPLAAIGLALLMTGAATVTLRRGEVKHAVANLVYLSLLVFVAWGRLGPEPFGG